MVTPLHALGYTSAYASVRDPVHRLAHLTHGFQRLGPEEFIPGNYSTNGVEQLENSWLWRDGGGRPGSRRYSP